MTLQTDTQLQNTQVKVLGFKGRPALGVILRLYKNGMVKIAMLSGRYAGQEFKASVLDDGTVRVS